MSHRQYVCSPNSITFSLLNFIYSHFIDLKSNLGSFPFSLGSGPFLSSSGFTSLSILTCGLFSILTCGLFSILKCSLSTNQSGLSLCQFPTNSGQVGLQVFKCFPLWRLPLLDGGKGPCLSSL